MKQAETKQMAKPKQMSKPKSSSAQGQKSQDAIAMLIEDHQKVTKMFKDFEKLQKADNKDSEKAALVKQICHELTIHAQLEEEIFYPAVRAAINDDDLMDEAEEEHAEAKELIWQLETMKPGDEHYDAKVTVLGENIEHHIGEEQDEMFVKAKKAKLDMADLGSQIKERKEELQEG